MGELDSAGWEQGPGAGFCEHGNEPSGFHKESRVFLTSWETISFSNNTLHRGVSK
jgi:hypothetical protein